MRRYALWTPIQALLLLAACTGITARETLLMPTMLTLWDSAISHDVAIGIDDALANGGLTEAQAAIWREEAVSMAGALASGDRTAAAEIDWLALRELALAGIQARVTDGELGEGVAESFRETVDVFDENWQILSGRE